MQLAVRWCGLGAVLASAAALLVVFAVQPTPRARWKCSGVPRVDDPASVRETRVLIFDPADIPNGRGAQFPMSPSAP